MRRQITNILFFTLTAFIFSSAILSQVAYSETFAGETESINLKTAHPYLSENPGEVVESFQVSRPICNIYSCSFQQFFPQCRRLCRDQRW